MVCWLSNKTELNIPALQAFEYIMGRIPFVTSYHFKLLKWF